jgi:anti-anti-sigma regulatory factor
MDMFRIEVTPVNRERCRVVLSGALTAKCYPELEKVFIRQVARGRRFFVVDLAGVSELRSCIFGIFLQTMALLEPMGGAMSFVNVRGITCRVLKMLGVDCKAA